MRKEKSWTRQEYKWCYQWLRRGFDTEWMLDLPSGNRKIILAADYSYQASCYEVHGWASDQRRKRFWARRWHIYTQREVSPF